MPARKVVTAVAAYCVLFRALVRQSHVRRRRTVARPCARPRTRRSFDGLQNSLSRAEFTRVFLMSLETYANLLSHLTLDLTRDMRMASRSSGGRVEPEVKLGLTIRNLSRASYLDTIMLFRVASSTTYDVFHRTIASIIRRIAMPGLPFQQNELHNPELSFTNSRQPPNPPYGAWQQSTGSVLGSVLSNGLRFVRFRSRWTCTDPDVVSSYQVPRNLGT
jgi:hypothetical protein